MAYRPANHVRSCVGLILAPIIAASIFTAIFLFANPTEPVTSIAAAAKGALGFTAAVLVLAAYPATIALGVPLFAALVWAGVRATPWLCSGVGGAVALVPAILWGVLILENWPMAITAIGSGLLAGLFFWVIAAPEINQPAGKPGC